MKQAKGLIRNGIMVAMAYKFDFILSTLAMPILVIVFYFVWSSIYGYAGAAVINGYTLLEMVSYYVLATIVAAIIDSNVDEWIEWDVLTGMYVTELLRPLHYMKNTYFVFLGLKIFAMSIEIIPLTMIGFFFFSLPIPSVVQGLLFFSLLISASLMFFYISFSIGLLAFWMKKIQGITRIKRQLIAFFSGGLLPLTFFPHAVQTVLAYTPFPYFRSIPINMYLGKYSVMSGIELVAIAFLWVVVFHCLTLWIWHYAQRHATGVGV